MALTAELQTSLGSMLYDSLRSRVPISPLTQTHPGITVEDAYRISREMLMKRCEIDREVVVGKKIGVTSEAVQSMLGVFQPDFGFLTDAMSFRNGADICASKTMIAPRAEVEIAVKLKQSLSGTANNEETVRDALRCIIPCFEIVDSRIVDWKIAIQDTIADNASCGAYVLGDQELDPDGIDLAKIRIELHKNEQLVSYGLGSAVQGNPLTAIAWLANTLGGFGIGLEAGEVILSGSLVALEPVEPGDELQLEMTGPGIESSIVNCSFS